MVHLVIGPTCAGKSTFIQTLVARAAEDGTTVDVHYAFEVDRAGGEPPAGPHDVVHLNLLRGHRGGARQVTVDGSPLLASLLERADEVTVLAAPRSVLQQRAAGRTEVEPDETRLAGAEYDADKWTQRLGTPHLAQLYEQLALRLDEVGTPHRYLCSHDDGHESFAEISRWELPLLARDDAEQLCAAGHRISMPDLGNTYQADYQSDSGRSARSTTLGRILRMPLAGKRLLDIGCAEGAASLSAARMGARVTGIDMRAGRLRKAKAIAAATGVPLDLQHAILDDFRSPANAFDVVLALNVIHHVLEPFAFLDRAAQLTSSHLVLEYPGVSDPKFRRTVEGASPAESLPFIGVSKPDENQSFVFSPSSIERYLIDYRGLFGHHEVIESPIEARWISVFSGKKRTAELSTSIGRQLKLTRENEALQRRLDDLERSRSWKLTAPLRRLPTRRR